MDRKRNLLFRLLALRSGRISPAHLAQAMGTAPPESLYDDGKPLVEQGVLSKEDCQTVGHLLDEAIDAHGGDIDAALDAFGGEEELARILAEADPSHTATAAGTGFPGSIAPGESRAGENVTVARPREHKAALNTDALPAFDGEELGSIGEDEGGGTTLGTMGAEAMEGDEPVPAVREQPGRYTELRQFARGGMGRILLVRDEHLGRDIALKMLLPDKAGPTVHTGMLTRDMLTTPVIARFLQEARITGQLEHPAIVPVYELGYRADGSLYYTMKLVRGESLEEKVKKAKTFVDRLPLLHHFLDLCQAIAYAHDRGVIHRDLKPLNVMIGEFGETVVIDWGIAKVQGQQDIHAQGLHETVRTLRMGGAEATAKTLDGQTMGSPYYMPPEQAAGQMDQIDERSDVYALGAVLYCILTGQAPYSDCKVRGFLEKVASFAPRPVRELEPAAPRELAAVCARAMARKPADRYPSAKELRDEIANYLSGGLVSAYEYRFAEIAKRFVRKHRKVLTTGTVALIVLVGLGVYYNVLVTQQRNRAVAAEAQARAQRDRAEEAEAVAVEEKERAQAERARAERELYFANISLTQRNINEQQMKAARDRLMACPESSRNWEWGHLQCLSNADVMTLRTGGSYVAFAADGQALITGKARGDVLVTELHGWARTNTDERGTSDALTRTLVEQAGFGYGVAASADGRRVAVSGERAVVVWDTATGEELLRFQEPADALSRNHVALSRDGRRVAALDTDGQARVWEVGRPEPVLVIPVRQARGFAIAFSPAGDRLLTAREEFGATGWARSFEVLRLPDGQSLGAGELRDPLSVHSAAFSPDGAWLALGTDEGLQVWDVAGWKKRHEFPLRFNNPDAVAFSPDGALLAAGGLDGDVGLWEVETGDGSILGKAHEQTVRAVAFSHDGRFLATAGYDRTARLWAIPGLRALRVLRGHDKAVFAVAFSPDDSLLATGSFDGCAKLWDLGADIEFAPIEKVAYHRETGLLAGSMGSQVAVWDSRTGRRIQAFDGHHPPVKALAFDRDGAVLAAASKEGDADSIRLWEVKTGAMRGTVSGAGADTRALAFFADQRHLAVLSGSTLLIRDTAGDERWRLAGVQRFLVDPQGRVLAAVAAVPGVENQLAVALWRCDGPSDVASFLIGGTAACLAFAPDGAQLLVGTQTKDSTGQVHLWETASSEGGGRYSIRGNLPLPAWHTVRTAAFLPRAARMVR